ncbi:MAG: MFS transporter [Nocardioides sp.]|uniref:MFS transporter n=1 Tax=Nocardioides sp. TaxID=35761 RepID=UPI0039E39715
MTGDVAAGERRGRESAGEPLPRRWTVLGVVAIALLMASVDQTIVSTALSSLQHDLDAPVNWSTWTITVYSLGQILAMPLAGRLSDQYGRKRIFLSAVVIFTAASLCCGLANNIYELVVLRAVQSLGGGAFLPSATGIVSDHFGRDRDRAIGLFTSIFPIGGMIGPVLGGVFVTYWSWRGIFLINIPLGIALVVLGAALLPQGETRARGRVDFTGVVFVIVGLLGLMLGISSLGSRGVQPLTVVVPILVGLGALVLFWWHSSGIDNPFLPPRLIARRDFAVVNLINVLSGAVTVGFGALIPLYAVNRYGLSVLTSGTLLTARAVGTIVVAGVAAFALRRTGYRWPMRVGFAITATGILMLSVQARGMSPELWLTGWAALTGIGMGISIPANNNAGLELEPQSAAAISGIRGMARQVGGITGVSVISAVSAASADPGMAQARAFGVLGVILICVIPLVGLIPEKRGIW